MVTSSGLPGTCGEATEHSLGRLPARLPRPSPGPLNQSESLVSGRVPEFMSICGWAPGKAPAGWESGCRGAVGGRREAPFRRVGICHRLRGCARLGRAARWGTELASARLSVCFSAGCLLERSSSFQSSLSISQSLLHRGMGTGVCGLQWAVSFGHFICLC